jgi:trans-aconitate 2-methyltransferase
MPEVRHWDGATYDRVSVPQQRWGREVLARLPLAGDELVLDAGCGSGRVTLELLERLPRGRVIAVDASASMVQAARKLLGDRAEVRRMDLLELQLEQQVDAVLSTATFHWILDHERLYARLHSVLRPDGRLSVQYGGAGNVKSVHAASHAIGSREPFASYLAEWEGPWNFTTAEQAQWFLERAGFHDVRCWLVPAPVTPPEPREFVRSVILGPFLERLPEWLRERFLDEVLSGLGEPLVLDYVRLNVDAVA